MSFVIDYLDNGRHAVPPSRVYHAKGVAPAQHLDVAAQGLVGVVLGALLDGRPGVESIWRVHTVWREEKSASQLCVAQ